MLLLVVSSATFSAAIRCYQAPLSWQPCWKTPGGLESVFGGSIFRGDSRFFVLDASRGGNFGYEQDKCMIPCGGVGFLPREWLLKGAFPRSACSVCTPCDQHFDRRPDLLPGLNEAECGAAANGNSAECCKWDQGLLAGSCIATKTGECSDAVQQDTMLSPESGIACSQLPAFGVAPWKATAEEAGFELRECENPTDVCASYCVSTNAGISRVNSCSHGCLPKTLQSVGGVKNSSEALKDIFRTSLAVENYYWCKDTANELRHPEHPRYDETWSCMAIPVESIRKSDLECNSSKGCQHEGPVPGPIKGTDPKVLELDRPQEGVCGAPERYGGIASCKFYVCSDDGCNFSGTSRTKHNALLITFAGVISALASTLW